MVGRARARARVRVHACVRARTSRATHLEHTHTHVLQQARVSTRPPAPHPRTWNMRTHGCCSISRTVGRSPACFFRHDVMKDRAISDMDWGSVMLMAMMLRAVSIISEPCVREREVRAWARMQGGAREGARVGGGAAQPPPPPALAGGRGEGAAGGLPGALAQRGAGAVQPDSCMLEKHLPPC